jgi:hypothetical protein
MKQNLIILVICLITISPAMAQIINKVPLSARRTYYNIDAKLDIKTKTVKGEMETWWVNNSTDLVSEVQLHLYLNAFRSSKTTFNRESGRIPGTKKSELGWIDIKSLTDRKGTDLLPLTQFIRPDDGNIEDSTVLKIDLKEAVTPGDTLFLKINFDSKLPLRIIRTGYTDDFFFVAQWFPKFGVYEPAGMRYATIGGWNCHQFHANSEFYSNHSVYDVKITLPEEYVVGSGGFLLDEADGGDGMKTLTYRAEDIVDFAWTAWPGYAVYKDKWKNVDITLLLPKERIEQVGRQFKAVKNALEYLNDNVGPYPWSHLTFVDPPAKGGGAGGMEYTTLFTSGSSYKMPEFMHLPELTTIHEFGHAYFMGILASNEFEEPWLDEGVNSFWEARIADHYYGKNSGLLDHPWLKISDQSVSRLSYVRSDSRQAVTNSEYSWNFSHGTYGMMSYMKPAVILQTLMGIVGEETINEIFREYYRKWAFRHPSGRDFINVANEVVTRINGNRFGPDLNWFFDQTLFGTGICDYKVAGIRNVKLELPENKVHSRDSSVSLSALSDSLSSYKAVVQLERAGEVMLPVDVLIHFNNNDEIKESWDGKSRFKDYVYYGKRKVKWVKIDPDYRIRMDVNYINNSMTDAPDRIPVRRFTTKFISFMQFLISSVLI